MKLTTITPLLVSFPALASAYVGIGTACSGAGYNCADNYNQVVVCNGGVWQLAADCGGKLCIWPPGEIAPRISYMDTIPASEDSTPEDPKDIPPEANDSHDKDHDERPRELYPEPGFAGDWEG
ncbi:hypothetical protein BDV06DRAFT_227008 [Aspergillus oleicola]